MLSLEAWLKVICVNKKGKTMDKLLIKFVPSVMLITQRLRQILLNI